MKHTKVYSCIIIRPCPLGSSPIRKLGSPYSMWYTLKKKKKKKGHTIFMISLQLVILEYP